MVAASLVTKNRSHGLALGLKHIYKASLGEIGEVHFYQELLIEF